MDLSARNPDPALDRAVLEMLDACRPTGADVTTGRDTGSLPEEAQRLLVDDPRYAEWFEQSRAFDSVVASVYGDVPLPEGLADRLTVALSADAAALVSSSMQVPATTLVPTTTVDSPAPPMPATMHRRGWLAAAGATLAATAAGWGVLTWWRGRQREVLTTDELLHAMLSLHQQSAELRDAGVSIAKEAPPKAFPFSSHVRVEVTPRWRSLTDPELGRSGVAYELTAPAAPRAVLYVLSVGGERGAPGLPPLATDSTGAPATTGGCSVGMWREGDCLVVLVVDGGDERRYRAFVERPAVIA